MFIIDQKMPLTYLLPDDFIVYYKTENIDNLKYIFLPEDHGNISAIKKTANFIEDNYQESDLVLVENFVAGSEVIQETCPSTTLISKKIRVMGWDIEEMGTDDNFKSGTISQQAHKLELEMIEKFKFVTSIIDEIREELVEILNNEKYNEISKLYIESTSSLKIMEVKEGIKKSTASVLLNKVLLLDKIDFLSSELVSDFLKDLRMLIDETEEKIIEFNKTNTIKEKLTDDLLLEDIYKNLEMMKIYLNLSVEIERRSNQYFLHMDSLINSFRIINTFQDRIFSMTQTLDKLASTAQHIFVVAGKNHFVEGKDASIADMRLTKFYDWMKDKPCMIVGPMLD